MIAIVVVRRPPSALVTQKGFYKVIRTDLRYSHADVDYSHLRSVVIA